MLVVFACTVHPGISQAARLCKIVEGDTVTLWGTGRSQPNQVYKCVYKTGNKGSGKKVKTSVQEAKKICAGKPGWKQSEWNKHC